MTRSKKLELEILESRDMPSAVGMAWPDAQNLTLSFAPDGTTIAAYSQSADDEAQPSALFGEMSFASMTDWQMQILKAFQTWAVQSNINIGLTGDGGTPFGVESNLDGVAPGGEIRVGAFSTSEEVIAINQPFSILTGAWSGDLLYNTTQNFSIGAQTGAFDLYSATLNEAANIFGLVDTEDPTSARYGHYIGVREGLSSSDIVAIQSLYGGARQSDSFEGTAGNETIAAASRLTPYVAPNSTSSYMVSAKADLTSLTDVDYFVFTTQPDTTNLTLRLNTSGRSLLNARVTLYDSYGGIAGTADMGSPVGGQDIAISLGNVAPNTDYTVCIERANDDVFGIGSYELQIGFNFDPACGPAEPPPEPTFDDGSNGTMADATELVADSDSSGQIYTHFGSIGSYSDVNWYQVNSPSSDVPLTVIINPDGPFQLNVEASVYDSNGNQLSANILVNGTDGRYVLQLPDANGATEYFIKVQSVLGVIGNYDLSINFTLPAIDVSEVASGALTTSQWQDCLTFTVTETSAFYFALDAASDDATNGVRMSLLVENGTVLSSMTANAGDTATGVMLISAGTYYIRFDAASTHAPIPTLNYTLRTEVMSDPIDPYAPPDPNEPPAVPPPPVFTVTDQGDPFYALLGLLDPYVRTWLPPAPLPPPTTPPLPGT